MTGIVLCEISSGLSLEPALIGPGIVEKSIDVTIYAAGAVGTVTWSTDTTLPQGLSLVVSGTGDQTHKANITGTYSQATTTNGVVTITAEDQVGQKAVMHISDLVTFLVPWVVDLSMFDYINNDWKFIPAYEGQPYSHTFATTGGVGDQPTSWTLDLNDGLPQGMSFNTATGELSGTPVNVQHGVLNTGTITGHGTHGDTSTPDPVALYFA